MRAKIIVLLFLLVVPFSSYAEINHEISGKVEIFGTSYFEENGDKEMEWARAKFIPELNVNYNNLNIFLQGEICQDTQEGYKRVMDNKVEDERWLVNLKSGYLEYSKNWFQLKTGKLIHNWSKIDMHLPSDNINSRDWNDVVEYERIGNTAVDLRMGYNTYFQVIFIPWHTPSRLPFRDSRWGLEIPGEMIFLDTRFEEDYNPQYAVKIGTMFGNFSVNATYKNGFSYSPSYDINVVIPSQGKGVTISDGTTFTESVTGGVYLTPWYSKEEVFTIGGSGEVGILNFHIEFGYFDQENEDDFVQYVIGFDQVVDEIILENDSLYYLFQYIGDETVKNGQEKPFKYYDLRRLFDVMGRVKYSFDENQTYSIQFDFTCNTGDKDYYIEPSIILDFDKYEIQLGVGEFFGSDNSFWGGYKKNDRVFLKGTYYF